MARATSKFCIDERWGGHLDIGQRGNVVIPVNKSMEYYTIELWAKLKKYPIIRTVKGSQVMIEPTLLTIGSVKVTYGDEKLLFKDTVTQQSVYINYTANEWFQIAITNGEPDSLGYTMGNIYINGKRSDNTMIFPTDLSMLRIGNHLRNTDKIMTNTNYPSESSLGVVRIYNRILDKHEVYNNYLAQAKQYSLMMRTEASPVKSSLIMELIPKKKHIDKVTKHWYTTNQVRTRYQQPKRKNPTSNYMNNTDELQKILQSLHNTKRVEQRHNRKKDVDANIIILSRNPEMFMKHLRKPVDQETKKLMVKTQPKVHQEDYQAIFDNPFKVKLLVSYLQSNPKHFISLLKSDKLSPEQLVTLSNALSGRAGNETTQANAFVEGFHGHDIEYDFERRANNDPSYKLALDLLQQQLATVPEQTNNHFSKLAASTDRIAGIMNYNHHKQLVKDNIRERTDVMNVIHNLNERVSDVKARSRKLERLLAQHHQMMGLIVSQNNGKCVGTIDGHGKIKHCAHKDAQSPYNIIVNKGAYGDILKRHQMHGLTAEQLMNKPNIQVLGQCINTRGKTVGLLVRQGPSNTYIPTIESEPVEAIPILAVLAPNKRSSRGNVKAPGGNDSDPVAVTSTTTASDLPAKCASGKCKPGFEPVENEELKSKNWLDVDTEAKSGAPLTKEESKQESKSMKKKLKDLPGVGKAEQEILNESEELDQIDEDDDDDDDEAEAEAKAESKGMLGWLS